jgi:ribonuclease BN (tRNA processing enzyme)
MYRTGSCNTRLATRSGVKTLVLTHFVPMPVDTLDTQNFTAGVRRSYSGELIAGRDLMKIE